MTRLRRETRVFFTAMMFLTRLPVPPSTDHRPEYLQEAPRYFPWIGLLVGLIAAGVYGVAALLFPPGIALALSIAGGILVTGAFHEDGFADVCDGFGGGWTKEKILAIMKDSRLGTFGVTGLISILALKFLALQPLTRQRWPVSLTAGGAGIALGLLLLAHAASRFFAVLVMQFFPYAGDPETGKSRDVTRQRLNPTGLVVAAAALIPPFALIPPAYALTLVPAGLIAYGLAKYFVRWIGGYTGDCLGAIQQVTELSVYLGAYIIYSRWLPI
ncbi:MAG TPA: adenosylcobinamide-GDP ribazoletransferase [Dinghuibacter sp.]|uniref:adenosylcobinamide-GDP ribazoletransferase n=1 Tax=Dinghuibacter sp. TaxID=2024697 RepID=UPI002B9EF1D4|nr:adenosylcobinamide-GDP ribazoletransferase [Dinghuibacter sp.]HTJ11114.1 adenosylcobinamide-GDP ribazoletransferase [Dinghuibacter sp.]